MLGLQYFFSSAIIKNVLAACVLVGGGLGGYFGVMKIKKEIDRVRYEREIRRNYEKRNEMHRLDSLELFIDE